VSIVCLPGDGIGPEVMAAARKVLAVLAPDLELEERLFGGRGRRHDGDADAGSRRHRDDGRIHCVRDREARSLTDRASDPTLDGSMQRAREHRSNFFFAILGARVFAR
jgi:hypothetical protein